MHQWGKHILERKIPACHRQLQLTIVKGQDYSLSECFFIRAHGRVHIGCPRCMIYYKSWQLPPMREEGARAVFQKRTGRYSALRAQQAVLQWARCYPLITGPSLVLVRSLFHFTAPIKEKPWSQIRCSEIQSIYAFEACDIFQTEERYSDAWDGEILPPHHINLNGAQFVSFKGLGLLTITS